MESVSGAADAKLEQCDCCQGLTENLQVYSEETPDLLCDSCAAVFWAAEVLWDNEVTDEEEIVPTLAFAARHGQRGRKLLEDFERKYKRFELMPFVDGVPILRAKRIFAEVIRYPKSGLAKCVRISILTKFAESKAVANLYQNVLTQEDLPVSRASPGSISWNYKEEHLVLDIGSHKEIEPTLLEHFEYYPEVYKFSFPLPIMVKAFSEALIGSPKRLGTKGAEIFARGLGDHGRPRTKEARTLIPACVAWSIGECEARNKYISSRVKDRRSRVARMLNRHLLSPLKKPMLADDPYCQNDPVWEDAKEVGPRFDQASAFLQKDEQEAAFRQARSGF